MNEDELTEKLLTEKLWRSANLTKRQAAEFIREAVLLGRAQAGNETCPE